MKRLGNIITGLVLIAGIGGGYMLLEHKRETRKREEAAAAAKPLAPPTVTVSKITMANFVETTVVSGSLIPREEILVAPEIEGLRVVELFADEGSVVKKGQVLARLVSEQLDAQMAQNDAAIARSSAAIAQAKSAIVEAEARAKEARAQLERAEPLRKSGYLSGAIYDQRQSAASTAEAQVIAARDGLTAAEAEKTQAEAQKREVSWRRSNTEVTAPEDGVVSRRNARIGAAATAIGEPMFRIIAKGEIELDAEIVETELAKVREGQKAIVTLPGAGDFEGSVRLVSPEVDKTTRLGRVRIFLGTNPALRIGAFARGRIETSRSRGLAAPSASVTFDAAGTYAQAVVGDKVEKRLLKTGLVMGELVEIKDGLSEGDVIVTRAGTFLRDGDIVRPIAPDAKLSEAP
ncbi:MAG: efflux transporter periplasmic adaptor subunit [Hyphomicrobium sp.]|nr:MAG: efflux transporter periplasmic adaptor subunit [Hyphomicrobium sp.]